MRVYRVEGKDGRGPYVGKADVNRDLHDAHGWGSGADRQPNAYSDRAVTTGRELASEWMSVTGTRPMAQDARFGFSSLPAVHEWFDQGWDQRLHDRGYRIAVYHAETVVEGERQALFLAPTAKRVTAFPLVRPTRAA